jgi:hypothetical protein
MRPLASRTTHLEARQLEALRRGRLDDTETGRIRSHLSEACAGCARSVAEVLVARYGDLPRPVGPGGPRRVVVSLSSLGAFARHHGEAAAWEKAVAPGLARALEPWEEAEAFQLIGDEPAYRTHALATHLAAECRRIVIVDTRRGYHLGRLAVAVAAHAPEERYGSGLCADLKGEAALALANAARCCSRFYEARKVLEMAEGFLEEGTGDAVATFSLVAGRATLAKDLGYYRRALEIFESGWDALKNSGLSLSEPLHQRWAVKHAMFVTAHDPRRGVLMERRALAGLERSGSEWLQFCARSSLAECLHDLGLYHAAWRELMVLEERGIPSISDKNRLALLWERAKVLIGLGALNAGLDLLEDLAREGKLSGDPVGRAHISMQIAEVLFARGWSSTARRHAAEARSLFTLAGAALHARSAGTLLVRH